LAFQPFCYDVLEFRRNLIDSVTPEFLYHYTTAAGLLAMLQEDGNKHLKLWATDSRYLNDSMEYIGGLSVAQSSLNDCNYKNSLLISKVIEFLNSNNGRICVLSMSSKGNLLSQWRAYTENGGYSLKLRSDLFGPPGHLANRYLSACIYSKEKLKEKIEKSIEWHVEQYQNVSNSSSEAEQQHHLSNCSSGLFESIRVLAGLFKHKSFEEECEWRHVFQYPYKSELRLRHRNGLLIPYTLITFPSACLEEIIVAPGSKQELAKNSAKDLLYLHDSDSKCKVELSDSSFSWE